MPWDQKMQKGNKCDQKRTSFQKEKPCQFSISNLKIESKI